MLVPNNKVKELTLEDIFDLWEKDSHISELDLAHESLKTPQLHHKYYKLYSIERLKLRKLEIDVLTLKKLKTEYYMGTIDQETLRERGWKPFRMRILKTDVSTYIDTDEEVIQNNIKIISLKEKTDALESIIKTIGNRGYAIKTAVDFIRFREGGN